MNPFVTKIITRIGMLVVLISSILFFQNCQKNTPSTKLTVKDSFLYETEVKILFDCTPQGQTGSAWIVSWTSEGLAYSYSHISPTDNNPSSPIVMNLLSKSTPPENSVGGGPEEIWMGTDFNLRLWTFPSPEAPFASITAKDGTQTMCIKATP
jgi:hypothetical protein